MELALVRHAPAGIALPWARGGRMNTAGASLISITATILVMSQLGIAHLLPSRNDRLAQMSELHASAAVRAPAMPAAVAAAAPATEAAAQDPAATLPVVPVPAVVVPTQGRHSPEAVAASVAAVIPAAAPAPTLPPPAASPSQASPTPVAAPASRLKPEAKLVPIAGGTMLSGVRRVVAVAASPGFARHNAAAAAKTPGRGSAVAVPPGTPLIPPAARRSAVGTPPAVKQPLSLHTDLIGPGSPAGAPDPKRQAALR
jgi:hypothetical protein